MEFYVLINSVAQHSVETETRETDESKGNCVPVSSLDLWVTSLCMMGVGKVT